MENAYLYTFLQWAYNELSGDVRYCEFLRAHRPALHALHASIRLQWMASRKARGGIGYDALDAFTSVTFLFWCHQGQQKSLPKIRKAIEEALIAAEAEGWHLPKARVTP
jgi:hypothetical protein